MYYLIENTIVSGTTLSSSSSLDQVTISSTSSINNLSNSTANGGSSISSTPSMGNSDDDVPSSPCARSTANSREYAYVDCGEVYLAGKRVSGIYEIWYENNSSMKL